MLRVFVYGINMRIKNTGSSKLSYDEMVIRNKAIIKLLNDGHTRNEIAKKFGISKENVRRIIYYAERNFTIDNNLEK